MPYKQTRNYENINKRYFDGIGEYFSRFVLRPLKNLVLGTTERDKEYCVKDGDDDGV